MILSPARRKFRRHLIIQRGMRATLVGGSALYQLDKRIPFLVTMLFDGRLTADKLVSIIQQSTGWQPSTASITEVIAAYRNDIGLPEDKPAEDVSTKNTGQGRSNCESD